ncbi:MAG: hypothetical protein ABSE16_13020 [Verrucomicrobiota bacterium]|jgi:uncharacterized protein involved in outer membrane biogenesis
MLKFLFKWLLRLFLAAIVLLVILLLSLNSMLRAVAEHNIRKQTGMDAEIGKFSVGLLSPTVEIQDLKIYNSTNFGGTPFLNIPEIHVEYDRDALARHQFHITLMRFNLAELDIVKNEAGQTNIFALGVPLPKKNHQAGADVAEFKRRTGLTFQSIDVLNVSIGTAKFIDLKDQRNNRSQRIDIQGLPIRNVKSIDDLAGLMVLVALRGGDFFGSLLAPPGH